MQTSVQRSSKDIQISEKINLHVAQISEKKRLLQDLSRFAYFHYGIIAINKNLKLKKHLNFFGSKSTHVLVQLMIEKRKIWAFNRFRDIEKNVPFVVVINPRSDKTKTLAEELDKCCECP